MRRPAPTDSDAGDACDCQESQMPAYLYALSGHLIDHVIPPAPTRQWVLSFPWPLRFLYAGRPDTNARSDYRSRSIIGEILFFRINIIAVGNEWYALAPKFAARRNDSFARILRKIYAPCMRRRIFATPVQAGTGESRD